MNSRKTRAFKVKFSTIFKNCSVFKNCLRVESASLICSDIYVYIYIYIYIKKRSVKVAAIDKRYLARGKFSRNLVHKKNLSLI